VSKNRDELVSVYMPTHNRKFLAKRAVESVLNQSYKNIELIVVDDYSTDGTYELLSEVEDERLFVLRNDKPMGACYSRNKAISFATGKFITGLDDDDFFDSNRIKVFIDNFDEKYSFLYDSSKEHNNAVCYKEPLSTRVIGLNDILYQNIGNQVFSLRLRFLEVNGFDEEFVSSQDYDLWTRLIIRYGDALKIPYATYCYDVQHGGARISTSKKAKSGAALFLRKYHTYMNEEHVVCHYIRLTQYGEFLSASMLKDVIYRRGLLEGIKCLVRSIYVRLK